MSDHKSSDRRNVERLQLNRTPRNHSRSKPDDNSAVSAINSYDLRTVLHDVGDRGRLDVTLVNLSTTGLCVRTEFDCKVDTVVSLELNYHDKVFPLDCRVRWAQSAEAGSFLVGAVVLNRDMLEKFIDELIGRKHLTSSTERRRPQRDRRKADSDLASIDWGAKSDIKIVRVPHDERKNYTQDFVAKRREWLSQTTGAEFRHLATHSLQSEGLKGNIENFVGVAQLPVGIVGPIVIRGDHAKGVFYVPLATTEGGLITTYQRGAIAIAKSGGARACISRDENYLDPVFTFRNLDEAWHFVSWVNANLAALRVKVSEVTNHGKLKHIDPIVVGRRVILKISYQTEDAMGANMINTATDSICKFIAERTIVDSYLLRSNFSSEKKASGVNLTSVYGKEVYVEVVIPKRVVKLYLYSTPEKIARAWHSWALGSIHAGMLGINAQLANGLCGVFIACGQDVAHVTNASVGINMLELLENGDLYASLKLPNLIVGTVGGGTGLGTQQECLEMLGCYGKGKAKKFAEIVATTLLAGEIGICAGLTSGEFLAPHIKASSFTRAKAYEQE